MPTAPLAAPAVVVAHLADFVPYLDYLTALLSPEETMRAALYRVPAQRRLFLLSRAMLRVVLGRACGTSPDRVRYSFGSTTKPCLAPQSGLHFNLSRSADTVAIALHHQPIGVDVEIPVAGFDFAAIVETAFSAAEKACVAAGNAPATLFYQLWTRKEALAKAWGVGITDDFARLPALDGQHYPSIAAQPPGSTAWQVASFRLPAHGTGSVAYAFSGVADTPLLYRLDALVLA